MLHKPDQKYVCILCVHECKLLFRSGNEEKLMALLTPLNVNCHASDGRKVFLFKHTHFKMFRWKAYIFTCSGERHYIKPFLVMCLAWFKAFMVAQVIFVLRNIHKAQRSNFMWKNCLEIKLANMSLRNLM